MTPTERTRGAHVELYARETLPGPAQHRKRAVREALSTLEATETIGSFEVSTWEKRIPCDEPVDAATRDRYLEFAAWADENDVQLTPFFQTRECYSMETGDRGDWIVLPALCLAIYEDDELTAVYPHTDGDTYRSVLAGLTSLEGRPQETVEVRKFTHSGLAD